MGAEQRVRVRVHVQVRLRQLRREQLDTGSFFLPELDSISKPQPQATKFNSHALEEQATPYARQEIAGLKAYLINLNLNLPTKYTYRYTNSVCIFVT